MQLGQRARDREAEAGARRRGGTSAAAELLEDAFTLVAIDAGTVVDDAHAEARLIATRAHHDRTVLGRELDRVADEVPDDPSQPRDVGGDHHRIRDAIKLDRLTTVLRQTAMVLDDLAHQVAGVDLDALELDRTVLDTRHLEQVLRELFEAPHVPVRALRELLLAIGQRPRPLALQDLERAAHDGERAAEVVRHLGEEVRLHLVQRAQRFGLGALMIERLALRSERAELTHETGHQEAGQKIDRHREGDPLRFRRIAEDLCAVGRGEGVRDRHEDRRTERAGAPEAEAAGDHEEDADDVRRPVGVIGEEKDRV